jgi:hypothetical protein
MYYGLSKLEFGISILLLIYVLGPFKTPHELMHLFKTPFAGIIIFGILLFLFYNAHVVVTLMYIFTVYELLKRADIEEFDDMNESEDQLKSMQEEFDNLIEGFNNEDDDAEDGMDSDELDQLLGNASNEGYEEQPSTDQIAAMQAAAEAATSANNTSGSGSIVNPADVASAVESVQANSNLSSASAQSATQAEETSAVQSQLAAIVASTQGTGEVGDATVTEAFTQLLGINSLENEMVNNMAPVGLGTRINYRTTPYTSSTTDVKGASLI